MLKDNTLVFIKRHWKNEEDYAFFVFAIQETVNKFKEAIINNELPNTKQALFECVKAWLDKFENEAIKDAPEKIRIYNCFAFSLINELLEDF